MLRYGIPNFKSAKNIVDEKIEALQAGGVEFHFNTRVGRSRGDVGIWHETYRVRAGEYECMYSGMPPFGVAKASSTVDAVGQFESARGRLEGTKVPVQG